jgi:type IV secretory pathway VirB6-like protein
MCPFLKHCVVVVVVVVVVVIFIVVVVYKFLKFMLGSEACWICNLSLTKIYKRVNANIDTRYACCIKAYVNKITYTNVQS